MAYRAAVYCRSGPKAINATANSGSSILDDAIPDQESRINTVDAPAICTTASSLKRKSFDVSFI
jgi:hypothetical protein